MTKREYQREWRLKNLEKVREYQREYSKKWRKENVDDLRFYWVWHAMKRRCDEPQYNQYKDYGGRGITYSKSWKDFENFKKDMLGGYKQGLTLDRIDVNGDYSKENCRWSTRQEQNENKRCNIEITYKGQTKTIIQWAKDLGLSYKLLRYRYYRGWSPERMIEVCKLR